jgi:hypothetical protein
MGISLSAQHGGLDFERITKYTLAALDTMPRYRQRLAWVPGFGHPVWIDDEGHVSVDPHPANPEPRHRPLQLQRRAALGLQRRLAGLPYVHEFVEDLEQLSRNTTRSR